MTHQYIIQTINGYSFRLLWDGNLDSTEHASYEQAAEPVIGIVLDGSENITSEEWRAAYLEALRALHILKGLVNALHYSGKVIDDEDAFKDWPAEQLQQWVNNIRYLLYEQTSWKLSETDTDILVSGMIVFRELLDARVPEILQVSPFNPGYVYLLQSPTTAYKIGRTRDPKNRMKTFGVQLPFEVEFICLIKTQNMTELESRLHAKYADKRINGEWFRLTLEDVEYIKGLASS